MIIDIILIKDISKEFISLLKVIKIEKIEIILDQTAELLLESRQPYSRHNNNDYRSVVQCYKELVTGNDH